MSIRIYRRYKCINCNKIAKTEQVYERLSLGNPLYKCQHCGTINYDDFIFEPALLDPQLLIKDLSKQYNDYFVFLYMFGFLVFIALSIVFNSFAIGFAIVCIPLAILTTIIIKKKKNVSINSYAKAIDESMVRLNSNIEYANLVIHRQGNPPNSAWCNRE